MKSAILAIVVAAGVGGFASSSYAQDVKRLQQHPAAAADPSLQHGSVDLPSPTASDLGGPGVLGENLAPPLRNPRPAPALASGERSAAQSKQKYDVKRLQQHPAAAADPSLQHGSVDLPSPAASYPGGPGALGENLAPPLRNPRPATALASGERSVAQSKQK
jgi:hypothetical protein